jgi:hypothetical protein
MVERGTGAEQLMGHDARWFVIRALRSAGIVAVFAPPAVGRFRRG